MVSLSRPYPFKFFKDCLPQILLAPFLNTLSHTMPLKYLNGYGLCLSNPYPLQKRFFYILRPSFDWDFSNNVKCIEDKSVKFYTNIKSSHVLKMGEKY